MQSSQAYFLVHESSTESHTLHNQLNAALGYKGAQRSLTGIKPFRCSSMSTQK